MSSAAAYGQTRAGEMTESAYIRSIAFFTLLVAGVVATGSVVSYGWTLNWLLMGITFAASIGCIFMFTMSDNPLISFIGVSGMSGALGLMMGPLVHQYEIPVVVHAILITGAIMGVMSIVGIVVPQVFRSWGPYLLGGLTLLIVAQFAQIIFSIAGFPQATNMPVITWVGIAIFTGYVAYDWSNALDQPYTLDNAIDTSGGLILDAVNLFLRILSASGSKSSSDD